MIEKSSDIEALVDCVTVEKAGEMLNKTPHCVRQLLMRDKLVAMRKGSHVFVDLHSLQTYYATKKQLPSWEENQEKIKDKAFVALPMAAQALMVQEPYIVRLIRKGELEGYVTISGDVMVARESINDYLRAPANESESL